MDRNVIAATTLFPNVCRSPGGEEDQCSGNAACNDEDQRRKNSSCAPFVEIDNTELAGLKVGHQEGRYKKAAYDEKDINSDEATGNCSVGCVKGNNWNDSKGAQAIDVCFVIH
ncbi:hypothetical protein CLG85_005810 [Yangia mangrovi]|uniref:Uncharacterized protein n=1 Tax=Alloyangia mangrovi TaxID=1779329 RepID=A0ABT2KHN0_9RHOB|nr:hypothetical protein [Alloyangia mangrovi]MCT4369873.1 hypothetical protein [Alloyangia mangrovi]